MIEESSEQFKAQLDELRRERQVAVEELLARIDSDPLPEALWRASSMLSGSGEALEFIAKMIHLYEGGAQDSEELKEIPTGLYATTDGAIESVLVVCQRVRQRIKTRLSSFSGE